MRKLLTLLFSFVLLVPGTVAADHPSVVYHTRFAGTEVFITQTSSYCDQPDQGGTYEIHVLGNGNLRFLAVDEDTCAQRSGFLLGLRGGVVAAEYEPVP